MGVVTLEKERVFSLGRDFVNLAMISGGDVKIARLIENEVPDIFRARRKVFGRSPPGIQDGLAESFGKSLDASLAELLPPALRAAPFPEPWVQSYRPCRRGQWRHK